MRTVQKLELVNIPLHELEQILEKIIIKHISLKPLKNTEELEGKMNQKEAAKFIGRSETTEVKYKKAGLLPHRVIPGTSVIIYYKSELNEFMRRHPKLIGTK